LTREKQTRSEQREAARAKAKVMREQHKKGEARKRMALQFGVGGAVVAVIALVVFALVSGANKEAAVPANMSFNDGIKIGTNLEAFTPDYTPAPGEGGANVPNIQLYVDYQCPFCRDFELPNQSQIESWVSKGMATFELHPISFLDGRGTPNEYSSRAANAAVCVAEYSPNSLFKFNSLLFANQPEEGMAGPDNSELFDRAKEAGISNESEIKSCINDKRFNAWIADATNKALYEPLPVSGLKVEGTPFVMVNDKQFVTEVQADFYSPARFAQFVQSATVN
jgi:protein-disulfide isomerase